jgi:NADH dehydrogenase
LSDKTPPSAAPRVVIIGGGYAALAAAITLRQQAPASRVILLAPRKAHIKLTRLHGTLGYSLLRLCVCYEDLGKRFGFQFVQAKLKFNADSLAYWQKHGVVADALRIPFDYVIVATGAAPVAVGQAERLLDVRDFCTNRGQVLVKRLCAERGEVAWISVIGGGATGMQFLFELLAYARRHALRPVRLRLVDYEAHVLGQFPPRFDGYAQERMAAAGIDYWPNTALLRQEGETLVLANRQGGPEISVPSQFSLQCLGVRPSPLLIEANCYGQAQVLGEIFDRVFAAGDCARFAGAGANSLSAQVALKKGRLVALNVLNHAAGRALQAYDYIEQGYCVSLGSKDAIGWLETPEHIITGWPALATKKAAETRYDLMLLGVYQI